jgi:hypothetical protein
MSNLPNFRVEDSQPVDSLMNILRDNWESVLNILRVTIGDTIECHCSELATLSELQLGSHRIDGE